MHACTHIWWPSGESVPQDEDQVCIWCSPVANDLSPHRPRPVLVQRKIPQSPAAWLLSPLHQPFCSANLLLLGYNLLRLPKAQLHSSYRHLPVKKECSEVPEASPLAILNSLSSSAQGTFTAVPAASLEKGLAISPPEALVLWGAEYSLSG